MKFFKEVEKHVQDLFKGKNVITNAVMLCALVVIVWYIINFFMNRFTPFKEGMDVFNKLKAEGKKVLCLFHMKDCGHCKKMMPEWDKFCANNTTDTECVKIEASSGHPLLKEHNVTGFPTIMHFDSNGTASPYPGERTAEAFKQYCDSK